MNPALPAARSVGATDPTEPDHRAPEVSVVVPVYNELQNVTALHQALTFALQSLGRPYEIIVVDDGSDDGTRQVLRRLASEDPNLIVILFRRNCGQTQAMAAGFHRVRGDIVVSMDGDLQNDPADIPRLVSELERGWDIVCGWRRHRKDAFATRLIPSRVANALLRWSTGVRIHDTGCSLKVYRAWVIRSLHLYSDMHRFIAALGVGLGARITEIPVRHHARRYGKSKYGLARIFRVVADLVVVKMLIHFAAHPIRWFGLISLPLVLFALASLALGVSEIAEESRFDVGFMTAGAVAALVAFNVFLLGFLAELQLKASRFFRRRSSITATEAAR